MLKAVIFDFDGLILDTETPVYEAWRQTFIDFGADPISRQRWSEVIGLADHAHLDPLHELATQVGPIDVDEVASRRRAHRDRLLAAEPIRPGITPWLDVIEATDRRTGVASSSPIEWVDGHLHRRGLIHRFPIRSCAGNGVPGKPAPDVYARACEQLSVDPADAMAIEDSPHGVSAAKTAGMVCVAVPGPMTASLDFSHADIVVESLADLEPERWLIDGR